MSIIHDALKKVQRSTNQLEDPTPQPVLASSPPTEVSRPIFAVITTIISIAVVILLVILWGLAKETTHTSTPAALTTAQTMSVQAASSPPVQEPAFQTASPKVPSPKELGSALVSAIPVKAVEPEDPLSSVRVQAIMQKEGKTIALINDNVYEEGQTVFGKIIAKVTLDSVTFMDGGRQRTFPVNPSNK
jgi:hypothetical protein